MFRRLYHWTAGLARHPQAERGLAFVSFVESSVFPIPADVIFVPMVMARPDRAWRLAFIASVASVLGGIAGWLLGHFAFDLIARPLLDFYGKMDAFEHLRSSTGTIAILIMLITSGLSHLPPMKVVTILAGVVSFSLPLFILSAIVARGARFYGLAWLLVRYGPRMVAFIEQRMIWIAGALTALAIGGYLVWRIYG